MLKNPRPPRLSVDEIIGQGEENQLQKVFLPVTVQIVIDQSRSVEIASDSSYAQRISIPSGTSERMGTTYFKRYRMEIDLLAYPPVKKPVPGGYRLLPWSGSLLDLHAKTKYMSFRDEIDAHVFPCFGELAGCRRLMRDISNKPGFLPEATWLALFQMDNASDKQYCGTIQGIRQDSGIGSIQNLGIVEEHRDRGLGTCLLFQALDGFRRAGLERVTLEVTAENDGAIRLYERYGFEIVKTVYKAVEMVCM